MVARDPENLGQFADFLELDVQRTRGIDVPEQDDRGRGLPSRMGVQDMLDDMAEIAMGVPAEPDIPHGQYSARQQHYVVGQVEAPSTRQVHP